ncbi:MAG: sugar transporter [Sphingobacteriaceae bacterium]|jgi:polysaccharide export outer membrane protein|nr:sugar transporter [Sphingobacteriaceae bacterium]
MKVNTSLFKLTKMAFGLGIAVSLFSSCASYDKIPYFQDLSRSNVTTTDLNNYTSLTIQPHDQVSITVGSLNPEASAVFNNNLAASGSNTMNNPTYGYLVDENGEVTLPLVGKMKVTGLTTKQLSDQLQQRLTTYLREPNVSVRIVNFKVAVLGDVMRPNIYTSASERLTLTEALALAGDLNITAHRDNVLLVRERDGKRVYVPIDLTSKNIFESPYFYLKSNDLIVVTPSKLKLETVDNSYSKASILISALSLIAITYSILK